MPVVYSENYLDFYRLINIPNKPVFVMVYSWWCSGSRNTSPTFKNLSSEFPGSLFLKVDIGIVPEVKHTYNLDATPVFIHFSEGVRGETCISSDIEQVSDFIRKWAQ